MYHLTLSDKLDKERTTSLVKKLEEYEDLFWFAGEDF